MPKKRIIWEHMEVKRSSPLTSGDIDWYCNGDEDTDTGGWEFVSCIMVEHGYIYYFRRVKP